jgi:DNA-binding LacI/PurR family transcriptional regulator
VAELRLDDSTPLYEQVRRILAAEIASGRPAPGEAVPSEPKLCRRFGVSQITVRRAMQELARSGLVVRRSGLGTFVARSPAAQRDASGPVALVFDESERPGLSPELALLAGELSWAAGGAGLLLVPAQPDPHGGGRQVPGGLRVRGFILAPGAAVANLGDAASVAVDPASRGVARAEVLLDRPRAAREAAEYLMKLGHRALGFIGSEWREENDPASDARTEAHLRGFLDALDLAGLAAVPERFAKSDDAAGVERVISGPRRATAAVCISDSAAATVLDAAQRLGIRLPDELSIVGHGGARAVPGSAVSITTIAYDWKGIAACAVEMLARGSGSETFGGALEVRASSARAPSA